MNETDVPGTTVVSASCLRSDEAGLRPVEDRVAVEEAVTLDVEGVGRYTLLCSPMDVEALAVGFLFAEGLISSASDVASSRSEPGTPWSSKVSIRLAKPPAATGTGRSLIVSSSCGACGSRAVVDAMQGPAVGDTVRLAATVLHEVAEGLRSRQSVFRSTGGAHAAVLFDAEGTVVAVAEDVGRHCALDKAVGLALLRGRSPAGCCVMMSGRLSYELVVKAVRAGVEILAGVSAPSSLAVEAARARGLTLAGFVREGRMTLYASPHRVVAVGRGEP